MYVFVNFCSRYIGGKNSKEYLHCTCGRGHNACVDLKSVPRGYGREEVVSHGLTEGEGRMGARCWTNLLTSSPCSLPLALRYRLAPPNISPTSYRTRGTVWTHPLSPSSLSPASPPSSQITSPCQVAERAPKQLSVTLYLASHGISSGDNSCQHSSPNVICDQRKPRD